METNADEVTEHHLLFADTLTASVSVEDSITTGTKGYVHLIVCKISSL